MENKDNLRKYLIYILKNAEVYYVTKNKVEREVYRLNQIEDEIRKENYLINKLFAIKNDDIRMNGQTSSKIEDLLTICSNNIAYYFSQKSSGNYINIKEDSTLEEIIDNIRRICNDDIINKNVHNLTEDEEVLFDSLFVKELKSISKKGIKEEEKYIKEKYEENRQKEEEIRRQYEEDIELSNNEELAPRDSLIYQLKRARQQGIDAERSFLGQK